MRVDQARRHGPSAEIDHLGGAADTSLDVCGRANGDDASIRDGDGLRDRVLVIDRDHGAIDQHQIGSVCAPGGVAVIQVANTQSRAGSRPRRRR